MHDSLTVLLAGIMNVGSRVPQVADLQRVAAGHARTVIVMTPEGGEEEEEEAGALTLEAKQVRARACARVLVRHADTGTLYHQHFALQVQVLSGQGCGAAVHVPASAQLYLALTCGHNPVAGQVYSHSIFQHLQCLHYQCPSLLTKPPGGTTSSPGAA